MKIGLRIAKGPVRFRVFYVKHLFARVNLIISVATEVRHYAALFNMVLVICVFAEIKYV
jgi:hypothetical protein